MHTGLGLPVSEEEAAIWEPVRIPKEQHVPHCASPESLYLLYLEGSKTHCLPDGAVWEVTEPFKAEDTVNSQVTGNTSSKRVVRSCPTPSYVLSGCCELNGLTLNAFWLVTVSEERILT